MSSETGVEVASAGKQVTGEQDQEETAEAGASKTTFSGAGAKPPVAPTTKQAAPSASDQAFGASELPEVGDPVARFRTAVTKHGPVAITIAGEASTAIGALLTKEPALAAKYFELVATHRSDAYRDPLHALFPHLNVANKKKLFAAQFGFAIVESPQGKGEFKTGEFLPDQIDKMYEAALLLPPSHMVGNPRFKKLEAGMGATFHDKQDTIEMPSYAAASQGEGEKMYRSAFCHEVGHAVDFAMGDKTNQLRNEFGWHVVKADNDDENLAAHFEELGVMTPGLAAKERLALAGAMASNDDEFMLVYLKTFHGYDDKQAGELMGRGITPLWSSRRKALTQDGITIGDQQYFACGWHQSGWAYKVDKTTFDAVPQKGKVSHYEWFAEWYATYYTQPEASMPGRLREFFHDDVDPFNQQRSATGAPDSKEGTGGETQRM